MSLKTNIEKMSEKSLATMCMIINKIMGAGHDVDEK
jgi:hypothetical protein